MIMTDVRDVIYLMSLGTPTLFLNCFHFTEGSLCTLCQLLLQIDHFLMRLCCTFDRMGCSPTLDSGNPCWGGTFTFYLAGVCVWHQSVYLGKLDIGS